MPVEEQSTDNYDFLQSSCINFYSIFIYFFPLKEADLD